MIRSQQEPLILNNYPSEREERRRGNVPPYRRAYGDFKAELEEIRREYVRERGLPDDLGWPKIFEEKIKKIDERRSRRFLLPEDYKFF